MLFQNSCIELGASFSEYHPFRYSSMESLVVEDEHVLTDIDVESHIPAEMDVECTDSGPIPQQSSFLELDLDT